MPRRQIGLIGLRCLNCKSFNSKALPNQYSYRIKIFSQLLIQAVYKKVHMPRKLSDHVFNRLVSSQSVPVFRIWDSF